MNKDHEIKIRTDAHTKSLLSRIGKKLNLSASSVIRMLIKEKADSLEVKK